MEHCRLKRKKRQSSQREAIGKNPFGASNGIDLWQESLMHARQNREKGKQDWEREAEREKSKINVKEEMSEGKMGMK